VLFSRTDTPEVSLPEGDVYSHVRHSLDSSDSASQIAYRLVQSFYTAHSRESLYLAVSVKTLLMHIWPMKTDLIVPKHSLGLGGTMNNNVLRLNEAELITFCVSRRQCKMYCGLCVCLSAAIHPHYCTDPDVTWGRGRGCPLVVHYWADLQSVHRLHCCSNITRTLFTRGVRTFLVSDRRVMEAFSTLRAIYRKWVWLAGRWLAVDGGCSQHYCGGLDCGLPMVAFWRHNMNAKCYRVHAGTRLFAWLVVVLDIRIKISIIAIYDL